MNWHLGPSRYTEDQEFKKEELESQFDASLRMHANSWRQRNFACKIEMGGMRDETEPSLFCTPVTDTVQPTKKPDDSSLRAQRDCQTTPKPISVPKTAGWVKEHWCSRIVEQAGMGRRLGPEMTNKWEAGMEH